MSVAVDFQSAPQLLDFPTGIKYARQVRPEDAAGV